jgi:radical SAM PhpK family P-methyltransferase
MLATADCVIVGYNDIEFEAFAADQRKMAHYSGAYHEIMTNSVLLDGRRTNYMDLINRSVAQATGTDPALNAFAAPSLGVCYLQSYLLRRGFRAECVNFFNHQQERFAQLLAGRPRTVAITTTYYIDHAPIIEIVGFVRRHSPETRIVIGGPHVYNLSCDLDSEALAYVFTAIGADIYITDSQGEQSLSLVLACLRDGGDLAKVPNLVYREAPGGEFRRSAREPENNEMDANSVDWRLLEKDLITPLVYMRTARSCPFSCSFCNYPTLAGKHVLTGLEVLEGELAYLHEIGTRYLVFVDDTFNVPLPRFKKLLRLMIDRGWDFQWISFFRCSNADEEAFDLMARSGCLGVFLGIESGDQTILNYMEKHANLDRYRWGIEQLRQRNIITFASLICGFPGETRQTVANTLAFIEETRPTFFNVQLYYHDVRSPIARRTEEFAIEGAGYNWRHRSMNWRVAADLAKHAFRSVRGSIPLSLYNFSIWSVPYLMSRGIAMAEIVEFGKIAREMLVASFDDAPLDFSDQKRRLADLFGGSRLAHELLAAAPPQPAPAAIVESGQSAPFLCRWG